MDRPAAASYRDRLAVEVEVMQRAKISDFEFVDCFASGQVGAVFHARCTLAGHPFPHKLYAIKMVYALAEIPPRVRRKLLYEFDMLALIAPDGHPRVVRQHFSENCVVPAAVLRVLPADTADMMQATLPTVFGVFDAMEDNLELYLAHRTPPFTEFSHIARDLLEAAIFLDAHDVIHRDLKLDNILVKSDGCLCLCDFGEAIVVVRARGRRVSGGRVPLPCARPARVPCRAARPGAHRTREQLEPRRQQSPRGAGGVHRPSLLRGRVR